MARGRHSDRFRPALGCAVVAALAVAFATLAVFAPTRAYAADEFSRLHLDWDKLSDAIRTGGVALFPRESAVGRSPLTLEASQPERWFGGTPHVSLVARDWSGVQLLVGGHVALTDQYRLTRSSRMIVSRVRLADGRVAPFAQLGLGQWRVDTDFVPILPRDTELATQLGGGFEVKLASRWLLAVEMDCTVLYREQHEPQMVSSPHVWGAFLASRATF